MLSEFSGCRWGAVTTKAAFDGLTGPWSSDRLSLDVLNLMGVLGEMEPLLSVACEV